MDTVGTCRSLMIGLAALAISGACLAEPGKPVPPAPQDRAAAPVVLASVAIEHQANQASDSGASDPAAVPKRKRAARTTTCRCGGQTDVQED